MNKTVKFSLRLPIKLSDELKILAHKDNRSLNNYIITILEKHVNEQKQKTTQNK